jgi:hypothetical protein
MTKTKRDPADPGAILRTLREQRRAGNAILQRFLKDTPETWRETVGAGEAWARSLVLAVDPFGDAVVSLFEDLTPMGAEEQLAVMFRPAINDDHGLARACHAVRMHRLTQLMKGLPVPPLPPPPGPVPAKARGRPAGKTPLKEARLKWANRIYRRPRGQSAADAARPIAEERDVSVEYVLREARRARDLVRSRAGKGPDAG